MNGRTSKTFVVAATSIAIMAGGAHPAVAQEGDAAGAGGALSTLTTAFGLPLTTFGGVTAGGIYTVMSLIEKQNQQRTVAARMYAMYLRANADQVIADLSLGRGRIVEDFATFSAIPAAHAPAFGRLLRANRTELLDLADRRVLTPERALTFFVRMAALIRNDRVLAGDYIAGVARCGRRG